MYLCYEKYDIQANIAFRLQYTKFSVLSTEISTTPWLSYYLKFKNSKFKIKIYNLKSKFEIQSKFEIPSQNPKFKIYEHARTNFEL